MGRKLPLIYDVARHRQIIREFSSVVEMASRGHDGLFFTWWISRTSAISELEDGMAARGRGKRRNGRMLGKERDRRDEGERVAGERRREARRAVEEAFYAFLSSRGFVCNNLCGKTAWEMTTGSLCNLNLQQFTSGTFWEMAAGEIRGHGPHYVCGGSHEDIYRESAIDERERERKGDAKYLREILPFKFSFRSYN